MGEKHLCEACRERKAGLLCFACFRSERDRQRARALAASADGRRMIDGVAGEQDVLLPRIAPEAGVPAAGAMTPAQRAHRFRMLAHLTRARAQRRS